MGLLAWLEHPDTIFFMVRFVSFVVQRFESTFAFPLSP